MVSAVWMTLIGAATAVADAQASPAVVWRPTPMVWSAPRQDETLKAKAQEPEKPGLAPTEVKPERFRPRSLPTVQEARNLEAKKLLVVGYMYLQQRKPQQALEVLLKALELAPTNLAILEQVVPLCFDLDKREQGMEYCRRALELDPSNLRLLQLYALRSLEVGNLNAAIAALERASNAPELKEKEPQKYLAIRVELAQLYERRQNFASMARALQDVIDVIENPSKYKLPDAVRQNNERQKSRFYEMLGRALKATRHYDEAIRVIQKGAQTEQRVRRAALTLLLAETYFEMGRIADALEEVEKFRKARLHDERPYRLLEAILAKQGRSNELLPTLRTWANDDQYNPVLRRFLAQKLLEAKEYAEAREILLKIQDRPDVVPLLTRLFREMNEPERLLETLTRALRNDESLRSAQGQEQVNEQIKAIAKDAELVAKLAAAARALPADRSVNERFYGNYIVAKTAMEAKNVELTKEFFERTLKDRPHPIHYYELILFLHENERYADVVEFCKRALERAPGEFEFKEYQARALAMQGKIDEALKLLEDVIDKTGDRETVAEALLVLSWVYQHAEQWDRAVEMCQRVIDQFPDLRRTPLARYMLSNIYTLKGDNDKAEQHLQKLVDADPDTVPVMVRAAAHNDLGYLWADRGVHLDRAEVLIRKALEVQPENGAYLDSMGWVLFKLGKFKEAAGFLEKASQSSEGLNDPVVWDHLGDVYLQLGNLEAARKAWIKTLDIYKTSTSRDKNGEKSSQVQKKLELLKTRPANPPARASERDP